MLTIGEFLYELRMKTGASQDALAKAIGISCDTYKNWERGHRNPSRRNLEILSKFYQTDIEKAYHSIKDVDIEVFDERMDRITADVHFGEYFKITWYEGVMGEYPAFETRIRCDFTESESLAEVDWACILPENEPLGKLITMKFVGDDFKYIDYGSETRFIVVERHQ